MKELTNCNILLASGSPRRRQLLSSLDIDFTVLSGREVDESYPGDMAADEVPAYLSRLKAEAYRDDIGKSDILITADTVVILDGKILGKPADRNEALEMLKALSGQTHRVVTGVTLMTTDRCETFSETTNVTFATLSDEEICAYVDKYKPLDKAGAYGVQEWLGQAAVTRIEGCYYNVMGLPTAALYRKLKELTTELPKG